MHKAFWCIALLGVFPHKIHYPFFLPDPQGGRNKGRYWLQSARHCSYPMPAIAALGVYSLLATERQHFAIWAEVDIQAHEAWREDDNQGPSLYHNSGGYSPHTELNWKQRKALRNGSLTSEYFSVLLSCVKLGTALVFSPSSGLESSGLVCERLNW